MNKKKFILIIILGLLSFITIHVYALMIDDPMKLINVTTKGEVEHGDYTITINDVNPDDINIDESVEKSNYIARIELSSDLGYYVSNLSVKINDKDLVLGFIAGSEHGAFFRRYDFSSSEYLYEFFIPETATEENKVEVSVEYAKKDKVNIKYKKYNGNQYDDEHLFEINNYGEEKTLIENYMDGDIVLPEDAINNGSLLKLEFTPETYEMFKHDIHAEARITNENRIDDVLLTSEDACIDEERVCYVVVKKDFNLVSQGNLHFGYNDIKIYVPNYVGFNAVGDVNNFNDRDLAVGFNDNSLETTIDELFYGTKKLLLYKTIPREIINDNSTNNCGKIKDFDNVTGSGYGYTTSYNNNVVTVNINSYYQDLMTLELTLTKNNQNIFNDKVKINLNRFAFNGQLLEVDSIGRNCNDKDNGNTCNQGKYYSAEYRGVLSAFYVNDDVEEEQLDSIMIVDSINDTNVNLNEWNQPERAYQRNKNFTPHVLALFYDEKEMIVETKSFDLNNDVLGEGYETKATFETVFNNYTLNRDINKNYIRFDNTHQIPIKNLDYFSGIDNAAIMHQIVLISKEETKEKGIKRIALFLINGEIEENEVPSLTYGIGEGKVLEIREEENNGGNE